jgi:single-strand DNA-binding protein
MYQKLTVIGRLGRDPEMRYMPSGDPVTSFSIATDRQWNDKNGQKQKETTWFRCSVFGKQAETANQYLSKGKMVLVEGRLRVDPKTGGPSTFTRQDGTVSASFDIVVENLRFLSPREEGSPVAEGGDTGGHDAGGDNEDIPF